MESKTIFILHYDHVLRQHIRGLLERTSPKLRVVEYILGGCALSDLKRLSVDLLMTGDQLLDGDGDTFVQGTRLQMPLLPIITLVSDPREPTSEGSLKLHRFVARDRIDDLLMPTVLALLHNDSLVRSPHFFAA